MVFGIDDAIIGGAGILGSVIGGIGKSEAEKKAAEQQAAAQREAKAYLETGANAELDSIKDAAARLEAIGVPAADAFNLVYEKYKSAGQLTPETVSAVENQSTQQAKTAVDPRLKQARMDALRNTQQVADRGVTPEIAAAMRAQQQDARAETTANQKSILENAAMRGTDTSGGALAAQLMGGQQGANRAALSQDRINAMLFQNQRQGNADAASQAASLFNTEYGQKTDQARAQDAINQLNSQMTFNANTAAANTRNNAQASNLNQAQAIDNANVQNSNAAADKNASNAYRQYQDTVGQAKSLGALGIQQGNVTNQKNQSLAGNAVQGGNSQAASTRTQGNIAANTFGNAYQAGVNTLAPGISDWINGSAKQVEETAEEKMEKAARKVAGKNASLPTQ